MQECSLPIKLALSFTAVAFREIQSTAAALMKLLLPIERHVAVCELQATHRPTIVGLLLQNCVIQVSLLGGDWNSGAAPTGRRPPCSNWFSKTHSKQVTVNTILVKSGVS